MASWWWPGSLPVGLVAICFTERREQGSGVAGTGLAASEGSGMEGVGAGAVWHRRERPENAG